MAGECLALFPRGWISFSTKEFLSHEKCRAICASMKPPSCRETSDPKESPPVKLEVMGVGVQLLSREMGCRIGLGHDQEQTMFTTFNEIVNTEIVRPTRVPCAVFFQGHIVIVSMDKSTASHQWEE